MRIPLQFRSLPDSQPDRIVRALIRLAVESSGFLRYICKSQSHPRYLDLVPPRPDRSESAASACGIAPRDRAASSYRILNMSHRRKIQICRAPISPHLCSYGRKDNRVGIRARRSGAQGPTPRRREELTVAWNYWNAREDTERGVSSVHSS
jgi:hypothetical protein